MAGVNLILMYTLTTLMGIGLGGILDEYTAGPGRLLFRRPYDRDPDGWSAAYALTTKRDFSSMGGKLLIALLALIAASIVGIFIQATILQIVIGFGGAVLFSLYLIYPDSANALRREHPPERDPPLGRHLHVHRQPFPQLASTVHRVRRWWR